MNKNGWALVHQKKPKGEWIKTCSHYTKKGGMDKNW